MGSRSGRREAHGSQMVLFGPFGRHADLHTKQHQGPLRAEAWFVFYFTRRVGSRSQPSEPCAKWFFIRQREGFRSKAQKRVRGFSHMLSLVWLPFLFLVGLERPTFLGLSIRHTHGAQLSQHPASTVSSAGPVHSGSLGPSMTTYPDFR